MSTNTRHWARLEIGKAKSCTSVRGVTFNDATAMVHCMCDLLKPNCLWVRSYNFGRRLQKNSGCCATVYALTAMRMKLACGLVSR